MIANNKSLEKLRQLINEETEYRSGPKLVSFFNELGFQDQYSYGGGFPSRWIYTDQKLQELNGKPELDKCIKKVFSPINFVGRYNELDNLIDEFNQFLAYDKWKVVRKGIDITFERADKIIFEGNKNLDDIKEDDFLSKEFKDLSLDSLGIDDRLADIIWSRFEEIKKCLEIGAPLSVIFLSGSSLEGILLGVATQNPKLFNTCSSAPKDINTSKVKAFHNWTLNDLINCSYELGILKEDVKKFSHSLRDFRNYIHPFQQLGSNFNPDKHTAIICWQVLRAAVYQISTSKI